MQWECKYCKKKLECKSKYTKSGHLAGCKDWKEWVKLNLTKEYLYHSYVELKMSLPDIAKNFGLDSVSAINNKLKQYGISTRTCKEAFVFSEEKIKATNLERYGSTNVMFRDCPKRLEMEANILAKYGVLNVFQLESVKQKIKETMIEKYGAYATVYVPEIRERQKQTLKERYGVDILAQIPHKNGKTNYTKPHRNVVNLLEKMGFAPKIEKYLNINGKSYFYDIYFEDNNKLIEVNGDYYHANPLMYKSTDLIPIKKMTAEQIWEYDSKKTQAAISEGYVILTIWEKEIDSSIELVYTKLQDFLNENKIN
jgi:hypothetical protein